MVPDSRFLYLKGTDRFLFYWNRIFKRTKEPNRSVRLEPNAEPELQQKPLPRAWGLVGCWAQIGREPGRFGGLREDSGPCCWLVGLAHGLHVASTTTCAAGWSVQLDKGFGPVYGRMLGF